MELDNISAAEINILSKLRVKFSACKLETKKRIHRTTFKQAVALNEWHLLQHWRILFPFMAARFSCRPCYRNQSNGQLVSRVLARLTAVFFRSKFNRFVFLLARKLLRIKQRQLTFLFTAGHQKTYAVRVYYKYIYFFRFMRLTEPVSMCVLAFLPRKNNGARRYFLGAIDHFVKYFLCAYYSRYAF